MNSPFILSHLPPPKLQFHSESDPPLLKTLPKSKVKTLAKIKVKQQAKKQVKKQQAKKGPHLTIDEDADNKSN